MDANQRLDYFWSELIGLVEKLRARIDEVEKKLTAADTALRSTVDGLSKDVHHLRNLVR